MGEWQKQFVSQLVSDVGLTNTDAMQVMGIVCEVRQIVYMEGYSCGFNGGWAAAEAKYGKPTTQPTTPQGQNAQSSTSPVA